jgi:DNA repair protein RadA/Sms
VSEHPAGSAVRSVGGAVARAATQVLTLLSDPEERRIGTGIAGVDRVLGGGLVPGSVVLLAGAPGIGKSTLLLQLASRLTGAGHPCLLASGEEARGQVALRARRLGLKGEDIRYIPGRDLGEVVATALVEQPAVLVVDSVQALRDPDSDALVGGVSQVRGCVDALVAVAKDHGIVVVLVGHVTKEGDLAGPRTLEHAVDTVLSFEGDPRTGRRILACGKNRFGPEGEVAWFEMRAGGLVETEAGSVIGDRNGEPGCAMALTLAGRRAFAVEVQALVVSSDAPPRRQVSGLDARRFHIVAAVTDRVIRSRLVRSELYGTAAGGLQLDEPGTDLAVAAALTSAATGVAPPPGTGFVGELSLTGSVRPVAGLEQRLSAAQAAGLTCVFAPAGGADPASVPSGVRVVRVSSLRQALAWTDGRGRARNPPSKG